MFLRVTFVQIHFLDGQATVEVHSNGVTTSQTQFCTGDELVFTCTLTESAYEWVVPQFLNGFAGNGRVTVPDTETVGNITLTATGTGSGRRSTLQVTAFPGLNGVNILCREFGGDPNVNQNVNITVLGKNIIVIIITHGSQVQ